MIDLLVYDIADPRIEIRVTSSADGSITVIIGGSRVVTHADGRIELSGPKLSREMAGACQRAMERATEAMNTASFRIAAKA